MDKKKKRCISISSVIQRSSCNSAEVWEEMAEYQSRLQMDRSNVSRL